MPSSADSDRDRSAPAPAGPTLAELQRQFFTLITAPQGVADGLAASGQTAAELGRVIASDQRASAVDRLDIYANMYFYRIRDTLRDYFPATVAVLDDSGFHNLITDYLLAHPSRHPSLRQVGRDLPGFAAGHALSTDRPWLGELAALEWARLDVFDRRDQALLTREHLATVAPQAFATLALPTVAALELVPVQHAVDDIWAAVHEQQAPPESPPRHQPGAALLVWRRDVTVYHRLVDQAEAQALRWLADGLPFGALCERLAGEGPPEAAAQQASRWLGTWLGDGLLAAA